MWKPSRIACIRLTNCWSNSPSHRKRPWREGLGMLKEQLLPYIFHPPWVQKAEFRTTFHLDPFISGKKFSSIGRIVSRPDIIFFVSFIHSEYGFTSSNWPLQDSGRIEEYTIRLSQHLLTLPGTKPDQDRHVGARALTFAKGNPSIEGSPIGYSVIQTGILTDKHCFPSRNTRKPMHTTLQIVLAAGKKNVSLTIPM